MRLLKLTYTCTVIHQIGLLAVGLIPLMGTAAVVQMQMMNGTYGDKSGLDGGADAGVILGGALNGVTTLTAFNMQSSTGERYDKVLLQWCALSGEKVKVHCSKCERCVFGSFFFLPHFVLCILCRAFLPSGAT